MHVDHFYLKGGLKHLFFLKGPRLVRRVGLWDALRPLTDWAQYYIQV